MKFNFLTDRSSEEFLALSEVLQENGHRAGDPEGLPVRLEKAGTGVRVLGDAAGATLYYDSRSALLRGAALLLRYAGQEAFDVSETPSFETLALMPDCSRNAVLRPASVQRLLRLAALMGYNAMMLYTEDSYTVEGEPYFGHLRGRYSPEELRGLDDYAALLGIELIPCIQTLAHLGAVFRWPVYRPLNDWDDILNPALEESYALLEKCIAAVSGSLRSRRINIGMDEAYILGRGRYLEKQGYRDSADIMREHLSRVLSILRKYGYAPRMWSDMFFRMCTPSHSYYDPDCRITEAARAAVPEDVTLVYWDYYGTDRARYDRMLDLHRELGSRLAFAGGASCWYGLVPLNLFSLRSAGVALESTKAHGIKEVYVTLWGDNGAPCSCFTTLPTLVCYSEACWNGRTDDENLRAAMRAETGADFDSFTDFEKLMDPGCRSDFGKAALNPTRYMLFQDVLQGKFDAHVPEGSGAHFAACADRLRTDRAAGKGGAFAELYDPLIALCDALAVKAELGKKLKAAYDGGDTAGLAALRDGELPEAEARIGALHRALRTQWMRENKAFGFDVQDIRFGALKARLAEARQQLDEYLRGGRSRIEELEAPRLPYAPGDAGKNGGLIAVNHWSDMVSAAYID